MEEFYNKHYITIDDHGKIVNGFSDAFRQPQDGDICINEQGGYQFRLYPGGEENPSLFDGMSDIPLYKYVNGEVQPRTAEELDADRAAWAARLAAAEAERRANSPEARIAALEDAMCEADAAAEEWRAGIEDALCELSAESEG